MRVYVDLHLHSCLSPCGDELMTPNNIAGMSMLKQLDVIAVADHNSARNLPAVAEACRVVGVGLLPAMELTTAEEVHLLAYFPDVDSACAFSQEIYPFLPAVDNRPALFGPQQVMNDQDEEIASEPRLLISALNLTIDELVNRIHARGGAAVPAHINRGSNGLLNALGFLPPDLPVDALETTRGMPCAANLSGRRLLHSSDAHDLGNISERDFFLELEEATPEAVFRWIRGL
ncbi:MAG: PHP domain-containing protein [Eubacteriales bacterium]|nr:PHP domain-containing protein [Eubacteriales bacterium]